jgi:DNA repair exonuclease SbcCD ATPase subunit
LIGYSDITLTCNQCGKEFIFSEEEQEFYKSKGFTPPLRCKKCRSTRRQLSSASCSKCGSQFVEGAPVYCAACNVNTQLEFEIKNKALQGAIDEAKTGLGAAQSEKIHLAEIVRQKEQLAADLEQRLNKANMELEKALKQGAALQWLEPALKSLNEKIAGLENNQNNLIEALLQLVEKKEGTASNAGLPDLVRGFFRSSRRSPAPGG